MYGLVSPEGIPVSNLKIGPKNGPKSGPKSGRKMIRVYLIATLDSSNTCMFVGGISSLRVRISSGFETLIKFLLTFVKAKSISHSTHNIALK